MCLLESILFVGSHETKLSSTNRFPTSFDPRFDLSDLYPVSIDLLKSIPIKFLSSSFTLTSRTEKRKGQRRTKSCLAWWYNFATLPASAGGGTRTPCSCALRISLRASFTAATTTGPSSFGGIVTRGGGVDFMADTSGDLWAEGEVDLSGAGLRSGLDFRGVGIGSGRMELGRVEFEVLVVFVERGYIWQRFKGNVCLLYCGQNGGLSKDCLLKHTIEQSHYGQLYEA